MSGSASSSNGRPAAVFNETLLLTILAAVQFTHILDFMIMMPLGSHLMRVFAISPEAFSRLVAAYGISAAVGGILAALVIDRLDRRKALLTLYTGFILATLACALAPTYGWLLGARIAAGAFGGVASSLIIAMVGDVVPPDRRGRGMAFVMTAFPLASVLGVPGGLLLVNAFNWHAPFFLIVGLGLVVLTLAALRMPAIVVHRSDAHPLRQISDIVRHPVHLRGFLLTAALIFGGGLMIPFMAPSMVSNVGIAEDHIWMIYLCGGAATFFSTPLFGRLADRHDKLHVIAGISILTVATTLVISRLGPTPVWVALIVTTLFFVTMSGRFGPAMAMVSNAVEPRYRAGYMSLNSTVQQASSATANLVGGLMIVQTADGRLAGYDRVGLLAAAAFALTIAAGAWLRAAAPHSARNPT
ncbi:MAG: MFS transporter [Verrucomicrobiota bacterium]